MEPCIVVREVEKGFGSGRWRTSILRGINMEVERGEVVFLVGPSGSGKTTLLSLLGCVLTPDQGCIRILGREVSGEDPGPLEAFRREHLGFVFQTFNLFPTLSALDNVRLALCMRGVSFKAARARAAELLDQVGLEQRSWLRPSRLSTGECQRVAIARALANDPAILLADEPTAALDAENGQSVLRLLTRLTGERGVTVVIVTHDNRIFPYADRILRLEDGNLTQVQEVAIASADPIVLELSSSEVEPAAARAAEDDQAVNSAEPPPAVEAEAPVVTDTHDSPILPSAQGRSFRPDDGGLILVQDVAMTAADPHWKRLSSSRIDCSGFDRWATELSDGAPGLPSPEIESVMEDLPGRISSETGAEQVNSSLKEQASLLSEASKTDPDGQHHSRIR